MKGEVKISVEDYQELITYKEAYGNSKVKVQIQVYSNSNNAPYFFFVEESTAVNEVKRQCKDLENEIYSLNKTIGDTKYNSLGFTRMDKEIRTFKNMSLFQLIKWYFKSRY